MKPSSNFILIVFFFLFSLLFSYSGIARPLTEREEQALLRVAESGLQNIVDGKVVGRLARVLNDGIRERQPDEDIYQNIMRASVRAINIETFSLLIRHFPRLARDLFEMVRDRDLANSRLYASYISTAGWNEHFKEAQRAFSLAAQANLDNGLVYYSYVVAAGNNNNLKEAKRIFNEISDTRLINSGIYRAYITAASKCGNFVEAGRAFDEACKAKLDTDQVREAYLKAAERARNFGDAHEVVNNHIRDMVESGKISSGAIEFLEETSEHINLPKFNMALNKQLNMLVTSGKVKQAQKLFLGNHPVHLSRPNYHGKYNFHGLGFGGAYVAIHSLVEKARVGDEITIIVGKGSHSTRGESIRSAVELFVLRSQGSVESRPGRNVGTLVLKLVSKYNSSDVEYTRFIYQEDVEEGESNWVIDPQVLKQNSSEEESGDAGEKTDQKNIDISVPSVDKSNSDGKSESGLNKVSNDFAQAKKSFYKAQKDFDEGRKKVAKVIPVSNRYFSACIAAMNAAKRIANFDEAQAVFKQVKSRRSANAAVCIAYMDVAIETGNFEEAQKVFKDISVEGIANSGDFCIYIDAARRFSTFEQVQKVFIVAQGKKLGDVAIKDAYFKACVAFINDARLVANFDEVQKLYKAIKLRGVLNHAIYAAYIDAASEAGEFDKARTLFGDAVTKKLADHYVFRAYINAASRTRNFVQVQKAFDKAKDGGMANSSVYQAYIDAAKQVRSFAKARDAFYEARDAGMADSKVYVAYMLAVGSAKDSEQALEVFKHVKEDGFLNSDVYGAYIFALGEILDFAEADRVFQLAKNDGLLNSYVYSGYIFAARRTNNFEKAIEAFAEAEEDCLVDTDLVAVYLDVLIQLGKMQEAVDLFIKYCSEYFSYNSELALYDLADLGFGAAFITSNFLINRIYAHEEITLVVGERTRSANENFARRAIDLFVARSNGLVEIVEGDRSDRLELRLVELYNADSFMNTRFLYRSEPSRGQSHWSIDDEKILELEEAGNVEDDNARKDQSKGKAKRKAKNKDENKAPIDNRLEEDTGDDGSIDDQKVGDEISGDTSAQTLESVVLESSGQHRDNDTHSSSGVQASVETGVSAGQRLLRYAISGSDPSAYNIQPR